MAQDFLGSIAQEDVTFITQILRTSTPGDNFWKLMVFIEETRFVADDTAFITIPGLNLKVATVTGATYGAVVNGLLKSWLYDFFVSGNAGEAYLVQVAPDVAGDTAPFIAAMESAFDKLKDYAYWKTVVAGSDVALDPDIAVSLAQKCGEDSLLSGAPLYPYTTATPEDLNSDPIYAALAAKAQGSFAVCDAILTAYQDETRNASLGRLGQALAFLNNSGTAVGNNFDYIANSYFASSGPLGTLLPVSVRNMLKDNYISFFKPVGDSSGQVASVGVQTLAGSYIQANWIVAYINFMAKCNTASYITQPNRMRNEATYRYIISIMSSQISRFGDTGSGRLEGILISAPAFASLPPSAGDEIVIPNAWSATYTDQVHKVRVYGTLTIAG